ncbi:MAG: hypothetical protein ACRDNP_08020 [Gaiellaceae bacterium]
MKNVLVIGAVITVALALPAAVGAGDGATVTRATLPSLITVGTTRFPTTCDETQVINANQRKETFHCTFDEAAPAPFVCDTSSCFWFSDFDGAEATSLHLVITPSGRVEGWATY